MYTMEEIPLGWRYVEKEDCYACMCGYRVSTLSKCKYHISDEVPGGYCENGFRCLSDTHYECVCGKNFDTHSIAWRHRIDIYNQCINEAKYKYKSYCTKCELQYKTPYALDMHYRTKRHINGDGPIVKDLFCKSCGIECAGQKQMKAHLETNKHKQILEHGSLSLECNTCGITCRGQKQMLSHLETKKHKKLLTNQTIEKDNGG